jgi:hypothetical protein
MTNTTATRVAAAASFPAVAPGAFGGQGLKKILAQTEWRRLGKRRPFTISFTMN